MWFERKLPTYAIRGDYKITEHTHRYIDGKKPIIGSLLSVSTNSIDFVDEIKIRVT